ncbi:hypothetical protein ABTO75_19215, partial [Acinetobacter baumannii]
PGGPPLPGAASPGPEDGPAPSQGKAQGHHPPGGKDLRNGPKTPGPPRGQAGLPVRGERNPPGASLPSPQGFASSQTLK